MVTWLLGVVVFVVIWSRLWRNQPKAAFGVLLGLPLAWIISRLISPYITGMNEIPIWLAPLPILMIAAVLFYFGIRTWLRADSLPPPPQQDDAAHGHEGHGQH
jgi:hypothetical protein